MEEDLVTAMRTAGPAVLPASLRPKSPMEAWRDGVGGEGVLAPSASPALRFLRTGGKVPDSPERPTCSELRLA